jgi:hypothetical protein
VVQRKQLNLAARTKTVFLNINTSDGELFLGVARAALDAIS